jgi:hypothetical protein
MKRLFFFFTAMWLAGDAFAQTTWEPRCIQPIAIGQTVSGRLETTDCFYIAEDTQDTYYTDVYTFEGTRGQQIVVTMTSTALDAWLELHNNTEIYGLPLNEPEVDDDAGGGTNARLPATGVFTLPATGTYYIAASTALDQQTGLYTLTLSAAEDAFPANCVTPIASGQTVNGRLETSDCFVTYGETNSRYYTDVYTFEGQQGQRIAIAMDSSEFDSWLELHTVNSPDSTPLYTGDAVGGNNARIPFEDGYYTLPSTGTYYIWANSVFSSQTGAYTLKVTTESRQIATEFYHPGFNHYFITAYPEEAANLAAGNLPPWVPTGRTFPVWGSAGTSVDKVWRFFSASFAPLSGHFYTNNPDEAQTLEMGNVWVREADDAFYMMRPPTGVCDDGTQPLYRFYNNGMGGSPNHRYTIDAGVRAEMIAQGWVPEGNGPDGVFACVPL